jgi:membrane associated rhomboid family serine protease
MIPLKVDILRTRAAICNVFLILLNVLVFLYEVSLPPRVGEAFVYTFGMIPARTEMLFSSQGVSLSQAFLPMVTSMFLHGGWMHLLGNMLFLWVFGGAVEDTLGHFQYLIFYFISGIGAAVVHTIFNWGSQVPSVGASGAISGVMGAFIVLFPSARVATLIPALFLFFTIRIPAFLMLGYWFFLQIFSGLASLGVGGQQGGVAWWAHVGGFLLGALLMIGKKR